MRRADNLTIFMCPLSRYPGKSGSPQGLYRDTLTFLDGRREVNSILRSHIYLAPLKNLTSLGFKAPGICASLAQDVSK